MSELVGYSRSPDPDPPIVKCSVGRSKGKGKEILASCLTWSSSSPSEKPVVSVPSPLDTPENVALLLVLIVAAVKGDKTETESVQWIRMEIKEQSTQ